MNVGKLKIMKIVHMKIENQVCSECKKAFKDRRDLLTHMKKVHLNVRDHACCNQCESLSEESVSRGRRGRAP